MKRKAAKEGRDGIDRWTNNGHGLVNITPPKKKNTNKGGKDGRKR